MNPVTGTVNILLNKKTKLETDELYSGLRGMETRMLISVVLSASVAEGLVRAGMIWMRASNIYPEGDSGTFIPFVSYPHRRQNLNAIRQVDIDKWNLSGGKGVVLSQANAREIGIVPQDCLECQTVFWEAITPDAFLTLFTDTFEKDDVATYTNFTRYSAGLIAFCMAKPEDEKLAPGQPQDTTPPVLQELTALRSQIDFSALQRQYLNRSQSLIAGVLQALSHPFYVIDAESLEIIVSNTADDVRLYADIGNVTGTRPEREMGELKAFAQFILQVKETGKPLSREQAFQQADGVQMILDVHGYPVFDEFQKVKQVIIYSWDITDRKLLEEEREKTFRLQLALSQAVTHLMQSLTLQDGILDALNALGSAMGKGQIYFCDYIPSSDDILRVYAWENGVSSALTNEHQVDEPQQMKNWLAPLKSGQTVILNKISKTMRKDSWFEKANTHSLVAFPQLQSGTLNSFLIFLSEETNRNWDQTEIELLRIAASNLFNFRSKMQTLEALRLEINERIRLEVELRQYNENLEGIIARRTEKIKASEKRYADLFNFAMDAILVMNEDGIILSCNLAAELLTGYPKTELEGCSIERLFSEKIFNDLNSAINRLFTTGSLSLDTTFSQKSGDILPVEITARLIETDEGKLIQAFARDISERKLSERVKDQFLSNVSHELRSPITSFLSSAQILKYYWSRLDEEQKQKKIDEIIQGGKNFEALVEDLLALSRIDKKDIKLQRNIHDLNLLLSDASELVVGDHGRILVSLADNLPKFSFDQQLIRDVVGNLLDNALKFSSDDKSVEVSSGFDARDGRIWFAVRDQGIGISLENKRKIFDRFYRVETASHSIPGTGLGLSIAKKYVELHGGEIVVDSELGKGTCFTVYLPIGHD